MANLKERKPRSGPSSSESGETHRHLPRRQPEGGGDRKHPGHISIPLAMFLALSIFAALLAQEPVRPPWRSQAPALTTTTITVGAEPLTVELAIDPAARGRGLGYRDGLAPGTGMLFVFEEPAVRTFWMKGMRFCLDIIWIEGGQIRGAAESVCPAPAGTADAELPTYSSGVPVRYVLEVPAGWLDSFGYGAGTPVEIVLPPTSSS